VSGFQAVGPGRVAIDPHFTAVRIVQILAEIQCPVSGGGAGGPENAARSLEPFKLAVLAIAENADAFVQGHEDIPVRERYGVREHKSEKPLCEAGARGKALPTGSGHLANDAKCWGGVFRLSADKSILRRLIKYRPGSAHSTT